jgi:hypothetical protein
MPASRRAITSRVTVQNPRPRKYASAAEKQAAFRARFPTLCVRVEPKTAETVQAVADASGRTQQETLLSMLKYAMTNRNWLTLGLTEHKQLPRIEEPRKENPMKRKPSPAQIAARERFAAMARSGAFKKKATKAKAKPKRNPIERYELRRLDKTNALDSTYNTLTHAKSALDEIDRPPASFYVIDTETGKPHFSFQAQTKFPGIEIRGIGMQKAYKRNPRAANPVKPKRQRMLNISWITAGGQRDMMSVPIDFVFTHYVGNVAERFFVRTENGQLIVSEYSTGGRVGQVPYTMRAEARNDREAAKRYVGEMLSRIGAERFKAAVKKFDPIN